MKNLKFLCFVLLFGILIVAGCENVNNNSNLSCEDGDVCPVQETTTEEPGIVIEETPSIVVSDNEKENLEGDLNSYEGEGIVLESEADEAPLMKIMVDEDMSVEEIEITASQTCEALGGTWDEGDCTLADGSKVYF